MFVHNLNPVLFSLGPITIYWYGLVYVIGFLGLYWGLRRFSDITSEEIDSLLVWLVVGLFIGARSFYFGFYRPELFSITEFFAVWNGGMSFHGGFIGLAAATYLWARTYDKDALALADIGALLAGWFLALGRVANFVNAEILGTVFDGSWCVVFPGEEVCRHPVQLYASVKDVFLGSLMMLLYRKDSYTSGFLFWCFAASYSVLRFGVQFFRSEPQILFSLQTGHVLSVLLLAVSGVVLFTQYRQDLKKVF